MPRQNVLQMLAFRRRELAVGVGDVEQQRAGREVNGVDLWSFARCLLICAAGEK
jgi:hypothetical protein